MVSDRQEWGGRADAMNAFESLMWRVEPVSDLRSTCVAIELLEAAPRWLDFFAAHEQLVRAAPRLRQRVVDPPRGLALPRWTFDPHFDLRYHVRRARVPGDGTWADLVDAAEVAAMAGFDRSRPPWEAVLYEGLADGRSAYVLKLHHAISDGLGIMAMLNHLHTPPDPSSAFRSEPVGSFPQPLSRLDVLRLDALERLREVPAQAHRFGRASLRRAGAPADSALSGGRYAASLRRVLTPPPTEPSPLLQGRSRVWRFAALDVDFWALRAAAKSVGGSINDAYLAALLGGYRIYHEAMDQPVDTVPVALPISLRSATEADGGNEIASARLAGPVAERDPKTRMSAIGAVVRAARAEPAMNNINLIAPLLARVPTTVAARALSTTFAANDLQASNVTGPRDAVLAGVAVERMYGWAPLPGCPAMSTLISYRNVACVAVNYDPAAFTDPTLFVRSLCEGFDEVLALAPGTPEPTTAR